MTHWAMKYIGLPWQPLGRDVGGFDCYGFFVHVQAEHFGLVLPEVFINPLVDRRGKLRAFKDHVELGNWREVDVAQEGDAVMMGTGCCVSHIGVWLDINLGGVLHCDDVGGVRFTRAGDVEAEGRHIIRFLRHKRK